MQLKPKVGLISPDSQGRATVKVRRGGGFPENMWSGSVMSPSRPEVAALVMSPGRRFCSQTCSPEECRLRIEPRVHRPDCKRGTPAELLQKA